MSRGIARVTLVGNLTRDPELRQLPSGNSVCGLSVAVNNAYKNSAGEWVEDASFFDVSVFGPQGENCARYLSKGRQVAVDGRLNQRSWEAQDGSKRSKVEVVANSVMFLGGGGGASGGGQGQQRDSYTPPSDLTPADDFKDINFDDDDDIPF